MLLESYWRYLDFVVRDTPCQRSIGPGISPKHRVDIGRIYPSDFAPLSQSHYALIFCRIKHVLGRDGFKDIGPISDRRSWRNRNRGYHHCRFFRA
jgi:hypothetical protein